MGPATKGTSRQHAPPDAGALSRCWHLLLDIARGIVRKLPADAVGTCVLTRQGELFTGVEADVVLHEGTPEALGLAGRSGGALPRLLP